MLAARGVGAKGEFTAADGEDQIREIGRECWGTSVEETVEQKKLFETWNRTYLFNKYLLQSVWRMLELEPKPKLWTKVEPEPKKK